MVNRILMVLVIVLLSLFCLSCESTDTMVEMEGLTDLQSIPTDYGELEAVTSEARYPGWSQMWFSDSSGVIRMVRVNWEMKKMIDEVVIINRTSSVE
ncbi:MAG: hypothetical protein DWP97_09610 [Calditrichaeota bacterium]|nr:MAG: hypothetical protein DWP97_09610 [Calditrichota bacterium]